ncbi:hypothetical protein AY599_02495 [Leptolyngbya valderiana BDU 20041]|nr:hypothetical protein AY599_02495 [Leptolyngbya valderiana BDU 20041]
MKRLIASRRRSIAIASLVSAVPLALVLSLLVFQDMLDLLSVAAMLAGMAFCLIGLAAIGRWFRGGTPSAESGPEPTPILIRSIIAVLAFMALATLVGSFVASSSRILLLYATFGLLAAMFGVLQLHRERRASMRAPHDSAGRRGPLGCRIACMIFAECFFSVSFIDLANLTDDQANASVLRPVLDSQEKVLVSIRDSLDRVLEEQIADRREQGDIHENVLLLLDYHGITGARGVARFDPALLTPAQRAFLEESRHDPDPLVRLRAAIIERDVDAAAAYELEALRDFDLAPPLDDAERTQRRVLIRRSQGLVRSLQGEHRRAIDAFELALADDPDDPFALAGLAFSLRHVRGSDDVGSDYRRAERLLARARRTMQERHPTDIMSFAHVTANLASLCSDLGSFDRALALHEEAHRLIEDEYPADHPLRISSLNNHAMTLNAVGKMREAEELATRAWRLAASNDSIPDDVRTKILGNLAAARLDIGRVDDARRLHERVETLAATSFHPMGPDAAALVNNTTMLLPPSQDVEERAERLRQAVDRSRDWWGPGHPDTAAFQTNLASVLVDLDRPDEALEIATKAAETSQRVFGRTHPTVAHALMALSKAQRASGRLDDALWNARTALGIWQELFDEAHPGMIPALLNLGGVQVQLARYDEAVASASEAVQAARSCYQGDHPLLAQALTDLGVALHTAGRRPESLEPLQASYAMRVRLHEDGEPEIIWCLGTSPAPTCPPTATGRRTSRLRGGWTWPTRWKSRFRTW